MPYLADRAAPTFIKDFIPPNVLKYMKSVLNRQNLPRLHFQARWVKSEIMLFSEQGFMWNSCYCSRTLVQSEETKKIPLTTRSSMMIQSQLMLWKNFESIPAKCGGTTAFFNFFFFSSWAEKFLSSCATEDNKLRHSPLSSWMKIFVGQKRIVGSSSHL